MTNNTNSSTPLIARLREAATPPKPIPPGSSQTFMLHYAPPFSLYREAADTIESLERRLAAAEADAEKANAALNVQAGVVIAACKNTNNARDERDTCLGYPNCDGDLVAEPHSPGCPKGASNAN